MTGGKCPRGEMSGGGGNAQGGGGSPDTHRVCRQMTRAQGIPLALYDCLFLTRRNYHS